MELQFHQFELLVILIAFLSAGILRGIALVASRLSRSELDYYMSLEATSDLSREAIDVDEASTALNITLRRKLGSALYVSGVVLRLLIQMIIAVGAPIATLSAQDKGVIRNAVDVIKEMARWLDASKTSGLDANRCMGSGVRWAQENSEKRYWRCDGPGYSAILHDIHRNSAGPNATNSEGTMFSVKAG